MKRIRRDAYKIIDYLRECITLRNWNSLLYVPPCVCANFSTAIRLEKWRLHFSFRSVHFTLWKWRADDVPSYGMVAIVITIIIFKLSQLVLKHSFLLWMLLALNDIKIAIHFSSTRFWCELNNIICIARQATSIF